VSTVGSQPVLSVSDRVPSLESLIHPADLERCIRPFLCEAVDGVALFDRSGAVFGGATLESSPMRSWEQLPPEAEAVLRRGPDGEFGFSSHRFDVRSAYAATERVGLLIVSRRHGDAVAPRDENLVQGISIMLGQLLQAGFATWVTSEMHLATSESTFRALSQRNAELERAINHLREIDDLKSNFLATVSHELRTPLTSVIGFSEMLLEGLAGELNEEQSEYVRTILKRGEELLSLISQVLEMSRLEVGGERLQLVPHDIRDTVRSALDALKLAASEKHITVMNGIENPPFVLADPQKLQRVLVNLLGNAIKFSREGGQVTVRAEIAPIRRPFREETLFGEEADDALKVTIEDCGIGIPADKVGRIFEAFFQVDAGPTREHGGAGLGLSIVRSLVQAHGGEVWVESEVAVGTAIHFTLPLAVAPMPGS